MIRENKLYLVIPCYNEEEVLKETTNRLTKKLIDMIDKDIVSNESRIVYVNDGSKDKTWDLIKMLNKKNKYVLGIKLSKNRGHQNALLAGLMTVKDDCDITISMDADLQDDINVLDKFVEKYKEGCEIVYGVRSSRKTDSFFKRTTAEGFYKCMQFMGVDLVYNHADYRLMRNRALNQLVNYNEVNLFLRGIVPLIGFKSGTVEYERHERFAGKSKYPLKKMLSFAFDGITSVSIKPIRCIASFGILIFTVSLALLISFIIKYFAHKTIPGWATIVVSIWGIGGIELLAIGVIGEYIGKIYMETKKRPTFIVEEYIK